VVAKERGIKIVESKGEGVGDFTSSIVVKAKNGAKDLEVEGAIFGAKHPRIVRVNDFYLEAVPSGYILILQNKDVPGVIGMIGTIVMFLCTYSFVANSPDDYLDEREIQDRNAAHMRAYAYAVTMLLVGYIVSDVVGKVQLGFTITSGVVTNYLNLALFTSLVMPATVLAWRDREVGE
jgi:hypothetical protein